MLSISTVWLLCYSSCRKGRKDAWLSLLTCIFNLLLLLLLLLLLFDTGNRIQDLVLSRQLLCHWAKSLAFIFSLMNWPFIILLSLIKNLINLIKKYNFKLVDLNLSVELFVVSVALFRPVVLSCQGGNIFKIFLNSFDIRLLTLQELLCFLIQHIILGASCAFLALGINLIFLQKGCGFVIENC